MAVDYDAAISLVLSNTRPWPVVASNGFVSRSAWKQAALLGEQERVFPMLGSMGLASSIAAGIWLGAGRVGSVVILDGDANVAMGLAAIPWIAEEACNLLHVVLGNGINASTGGQPLCPLDLPSLVVAAGYRSARRCTSEAQMQDALCDWERNEYRATAGPVLIEVATGAPARVAPRVSPAPPSLVERFRIGLGHIRAQDEVE